MSPRKFYLNKRSNGYSYIGYWHEGKRAWISAGTKSKTEALIAVHDFEDHRTNNRSQMTLSEFRKQFFGVYGSISSPGIEGGGSQSRAPRISPQNQVSPAFCR